jgi:hypothetical protein
MLVSGNNLQTKLQDKDDVSLEITAGKLSIC